MKPISELGYEEARDELIEVVQQLEHGGLDLDASLKLWERGEELALDPADHHLGRGLCRPGLLAQTVEEIRASGRVALGVGLDVLGDVGRHRSRSSSLGQTAPGRDTYPLGMAHYGRVALALLVAAAGAVHLYLYFDYFHRVHVVGVPSSGSTVDSCGSPRANHSATTSNSACVQG